jgi:hypothetical protein
LSKYEGDLLVERINIGISWMRSEEKTTVVLHHSFKNSKFKLRGYGMKKYVTAMQLSWKSKHKAKQHQSGIALP